MPWRQFYEHFGGEEKSKKENLIFFSYVSQKNLQNVSHSAFDNSFESFEDLQKNQARKV